MNLEEAVEVRRSRRTYDPTPIDPASLEKLEQLIAQYSKEAGLRIELVLNNGDAFGGLLKSRGLFSGVRHYIGLIKTEGDPFSVEKLGYYGQLLMLNATAMGLGSCWVGGSFDRSSCPFTLLAEETIACVIVIGNAVEGFSIKEKLIQNIIHRKSKDFEEMYVSDCDVPAWFIAGMKAVQKAPSAINRQPVLFSYKSGKAGAGIEGTLDDGFYIDLGIAKCNFMIGAGGGTWAWGNHAEFSYKQK